VRNIMAFVTSTTNSNVRVKSQGQLQTQKNNQIAKQNERDVVRSWVVSRKRA